MEDQIEPLADAPSAETPSAAKAKRRQELVDELYWLQTDAKGQPVTLNPEELQRRNALLDEIESLDPK